MRELRLGRRLRARLSPSPVERAAARLDLTIVRPFDGGVFGAVLVQRADSEQLVLTASDDISLASEWATGAAMATRLRARGYPAPVYAGTGCDDDVAWSLQHVLAGEVPALLSEACALQLIGLAQAHAVDAGTTRAWDVLARQAAMRWLLDIGSLPHAFDDRLAAVLRDTADVTVLRTTIVHGDFHHRNCLVSGEQITGVFDWDIAGAGDWRFDLVCLAFGSAVGPKTCEPGAAEAFVAAARAECDAATAAFLMACQTLRILSMTRTRRPAALERTSTRLEAALGGWFG